MELTATAMSSNNVAVGPSYMSERDTDGERSYATKESSSSSSASTFLNEPESSEQNESKSQLLILAEDNNSTKELAQQKSKQQQLIITITLTFALLVQSISTTILTILWPLLAHDRFHLSAHTFGILTFISSVFSTGAVAAFPVVERFEKIGGRVRCAAWAFGLGAVLCLAFCICSFGDDFFGTTMPVMDLVGGSDGDGWYSN